MFGTVGLGNDCGWCLWFEWWLPLLSVVCGLCLRFLFAGLCCRGLLLGFGWFWVWLILFCLYLLCWRFLFLGIAVVYFWILRFWVGVLIAGDLFGLGVTFGGIVLVCYAMDVLCGLFGFGCLIVLYIVTLFIVALRELWFCA